MNLEILKVKDVRVILSLIVVVDTVVICTDMKACGKEGEECIHALGVLRVSLGCYVSFSYQSFCSLTNHYILLLLYLWI